MSVWCAAPIEITLHTPYVDAVSADEDSRGIWILSHSLRHAILEVLLVRCIFDDRHLQSVEVRKGVFHAAYANAFDHLDFVKKEAKVVRLLHQMMKVNATSYSMTLRVRCVALHQ